MARVSQIDGLKARPHDLRHMYGAQAAKAGLRGRQLMEAMGHARLTANTRCTKADVEARVARAMLVETRLAAMFAGQPVAPIEMGTVH